MNFRSKKWTVLGLFILIILAVSIFIQFTLGLGVFRSDLKNIFLNSISQNPFHKQSKLNASLVDLQLSLNFEILESDKTAFQNFVWNWFGEQEEIKSIKMAIDKNLAQTLAPILPAKLNLKIADNFLEFKSQSIPELKTTLTGIDIDFATGSGKLKLKYANPTQYHLDIENPNDLAFYATASGLLTASDKIDGLFKSLSQVATIELEVFGKNITGRIVLK